MSILSRDELESLDMSRILKELTPLEEKLLEAYKELEDEVVGDEYVTIADFKRVCDENATLKAELEEANKLVNTLRAKLDKTSKS